MLASGGSVQQERNVSHISNLKFSSSHIEKTPENQVK